MRDDDSTGMSRAERLALLFVSLAMVVVAIVVIGRVSEPGGGRIGVERDRPAPAPNVPLPISVSDAFELAGNWANTWNDEAYLILVSARFEFPGQSSSATPMPDGGIIVFSFAAPKDGDEWPRASVAVSRQTGTIFFDETTAFAVKPPGPIGDVLPRLPISAEQAFTIASSVVGAPYREGCESSRRQVQVNLDTTESDSAWWVVVYYDTRRQDENDIVVRVNAETGELNQEIRGETSCDVALHSPGIVTNQAAVQGVHLFV